MRSNRDLGRSIAASERSDIALLTFVKQPAAFLKLWFVALLSFDRPLNLLAFSLYCLILDLSKGRNF